METLPINKILIANRGEIALRIKRAAQLLHIPAAAVYTGREKDSFWIHEFGDAFSLGDGKLSETYLNIPLIISIARRAGADAIHPGYGFLSENHMFARACEENGIRFIGPSSGVIKLMADKLAAGEFVASLGIPVTDKIIDSPREISKKRNDLEYPVLVKAAAGGGGKGIRIARSPHELTDVLEITASEANHFFADDRVYVEKYLRSPRHIEIQILGDAHGHIVHLYERECSIQRRHQKIIEEAPAEYLTGDLRRRLIDAALAIAHAVHYVNAGTVEFLLDENGDLFFLEMNPRIQVEHGITEMITGIDLVREQIRIAEGYPLPFAQSGIHCRGNAVEARIYAEDPENNLLPSPGTIHYFSKPVLENTRTESSVSAGSRIHADFDPLLAKVISWGNSRGNAIQSMEKMLKQLIITGVPHNLPLIREILQDRDYLRNSISTTYLQDQTEMFLGKIRQRKENAGTIELIMAGLLIALSAQKLTSGDSVWKSVGHWRLIPRMSFGYHGKRHEIYYRHTGPDTLEIWCGHEKYNLTRAGVDDYSVSFTYDGKFCHYYHIPEVNGMLILTDGDLNFELERFGRLKQVDFEDLQFEESDGKGIIRSPLPGKVTHVYVSPDQKVNRGDNLMTIESMKLENSILAPYAGIVQQIKIFEGEQVKRNDPIIYLRPE